jgi:hypothetical protein
MKNENPKVKIITAAQWETLKALDEEVSNSTFQLFHLANVVKLAGFACEARRVLDCMAGFVRTDEPSFKKMADDVSSCMQWIEHEDTSGEVLREAGKQLYDIAEFLNGPFGSGGVLDQVVRESEGQTS